MSERVGRVVEPFSDPRYACWWCLAPAKRRITFHRHDARPRKFYACLKHVDEEEPE